MKITGCTIVTTLLCLWTCYGQSRLTGRILYHNSGEKPAQGVQVNAPGANAVFTTDSGLFTLYFSRKKPGDKANLWVGDIDGKGKSIVVVNKKSIQVLSIPSNPDDHPVEIVVASPGQIAKTRAQFYGILEKLISGRYDKKLNNIEKQLKQRNLDAKATATLNEKIEKLRKERNAAFAKIKEQSAHIANINKDRASEEIKTAVENIGKGKGVDEALKVLDSLRLKETANKVSDKKIEPALNFYIGTNFNFSTGYLPESIYYEVNAAFPDLFTSGWGIRGGVYKHNISGYKQDFMLRPHHYEFVSEIPEGNSYNLVQTGMTPVVSIRSIGFYLETPFKIITSEYVDLFVSPRLELITRNARYSYEVAYETILNTTVIPYTLGDSGPPLPREVHTTYWESYLGIGFPLQYRIPGEILEINANPIIGAGYPGPSAVFRTFYTGIPDYDYVQIVEEDNSPLFFGAFQCNIIIDLHKNFGIKMGADLRKYFNTGRDPLLNINLAAKLDVTGILKAAED